MPLSRLEYLFNRYVNQTSSTDEETELMQLLADSQNKQEVDHLLDDLMKHPSLTTTLNERSAGRILKDIIERSKKANRRNAKIRPLYKYKVAAAAVLILCISGLTFWILSKSGSRNEAQIVAINKTPVPQIVPGGKHAKLILSDGTQILLDSTEDKIISLPHFNLQVKKGVLTFQNLNSSALLNAAPGLNKLITPRGGQYQVILSDGTKVWLNTASCLQFPSAFTGASREVRLHGEAYFEVAKNKRKPFHVSVHNIKVEVLGTHFNIKAYRKESDIKTTLLEGSVRITSQDQSKLITPGEQATFYKKDGLIETKHVDVNQVIAWKNGLFQFDGADITSIMSELGRWYDVDIEYEGKLPHRTFEGKISRDAQLSDVLKILALSNVKFNVVGKKIIVK